MSKEQLDAVKEQFLAAENDDLRQKVFGAYLEDPERGANMIVAFATDKGLQIDATPGEIVDYMDSLDEDEIDIEMTPEMLGSVSGGRGCSVNWGKAVNTCQHPKGEAGCRADGIG